MRWKCCSPRSWACARSSAWGKLGTIALDGTKVAANAEVSKSANRSLARLRDLAAQVVAEHATTDAAEDEAYGPGRAHDEVAVGTCGARSPGAGEEGPGRADRPGQGQPAGRAGRPGQSRSRGPGRQGRARYRDRKCRRRGGPARSRPARRPRIAQEAVDRAVPPRSRRRSMTGTPATRQISRAAGGPGLDQRTRPRAAAADLCPGPRGPGPAGPAARQRAAAREAARAAKEKEHPGPSRNVTDPDSRLMPVRGAAGSSRAGQRCRTWSAKTG